MTTSDENITLVGDTKISILKGTSNSFMIDNISPITLFWRVKDSNGRGELYPNENITLDYDVELWNDTPHSPETKTEVHIVRNLSMATAMDHCDAIARGMLYGSRTGHAVGSVSSVTAITTGYDISEIGGSLIPSPDIANGETMAFISDDPEDNPTGLGAREITIKYIDPTTGELTGIILPTNGTTETVIPVSMSFVNDFYVSKNGMVDGEYTTAYGDITLYRQGTPARVYTIIKALGNKSFTMSRLIPSDKDFYMTQYVISGNTKGVSIRLRANIGDDGVPTDGWLFKLPLTIGDTAVPVFIDPPLRLPGGTRFKVSIYGANVPSVDASVFINGTLEPKM